MNLDIQRFAELRPYLYHLSARENLPAILRTRELRCARLLLEAAQKVQYVSERRTDHLLLDASEGSILIRDQKPLSVGAIKFEMGWDLARFVAHVNQHVFFWPGAPSGPIRAGMNHFARYRHEGPAIVRFKTDPKTLSSLLYCRFNSGAPRCSGGKYSPRGSDTYLPPNHFNGNPGDVIEVVARDAFPLPCGAEVANSVHGPWRELSGVA